MKLFLHPGVKTLVELCLFNFEIRGRASEPAGGGVFFYARSPEVFFYARSARAFYFDSKPNRSVGPGVKNTLWPFPI